MKDSLINNFIKLVSIYSPSGEEKEMINYLKEWFSKYKLKPRIDKVGNLYVKIRGKGEPILFCAHMDTVNPGVGIKPIVKNGYIYSSGNTILGADNKAFIASLLTALALNKSQRAIELLFTVKEETGGGIEFFTFNWIKSKKAVTFDSAKPIGGIILRSPYVFNFHVLLIGKATHSSTPAKGKNAIIPALELINNIQVGELDKKETTINIGLISGGVGINIIPEKIQFSGEVRSYNQKLLYKHVNHIETITKKIADKYSVKYKLSKDGFCPGYVHRDNDNFVKDIRKIYTNLNLKTKYYNFWHW